MWTLQYMYSGSFIHQSAVLPRKTSMQELEWKYCRVGQSVKLLLASASTVIPAFSLLEIHDQDFYSLLDVYAFWNGASSLTKERSVFLFTHYVCCTIVSAWVYTRCRSIQVTVDSVHPLIVVVQLLPWEHVCLRSCYSVTAVVYLLISWSLPSSGSECHNILFWLSTWYLQGVFSCSWQIHVTGTPHSPYMSDNKEFTLFMKAYFCIFCYLILGFKGLPISLRQ
jgi:hypothetical protein